MSFQDLEAGRISVKRGGGAAAAGQTASQAVAAGIFQINTSVSTFQRLVNSLGTPKDTPDLRERLGTLKLQAQDKSIYNGFGKRYLEKLKQASEADRRTQVSASKKIADAKLAKDLQAVLKEFQRAQRLAVERESAYAPFISSSLLPSSYNAGEVEASPDQSSEQQALLQSARQEVLFLDNEIVYNEAVIEEREQGIQEIQQQIGEVNEIFKDLAVLVHDQGAMIDDIDTHIENSVAATAQARAQLVKAAKSQKSSSSLICLLLVIFGVVLLIVIIVLAA